MGFFGEQRKTFLLGKEEVVLNWEKISLEPRLRLAFKVVRCRFEIDPDHQSQPYAAAQTWSVAGTKKPSRWCGGLMVSLLWQSGLSALLVRFVQSVKPPIKTDHVMRVQSGRSHLCR